MTTQLLDSINVSDSGVNSLSIESWNSISHQVEMLVVRASNEVAFKERLLSDPLPHLQEAGVHLPEGVGVCFVEDLLVPWQIVVAEDSQSVLYSLRLPSALDEGAEASAERERGLLGSRVAGLYAMYAPLRSCNNNFPNLENNVSPSVILANLEVLFVCSEGEIRMPLPSNWREQGNAVARLIAQAWLDDAFKARFMQDPVPLLEEAGVSIPDGLTVEVVEGLEVPWKIVASADAQGATYSINIPAKPDDISDEELGEAARGVRVTPCSACFCCV